MSTDGAGIDPQLAERLREVAEQGDEGVAFSKGELVLSIVLGAVLPLALLAGGWVLYVA